MSNIQNTPKTNESWSNGNLPGLASDDNRNMACTVSPLTGRSGCSANLDIEGNGSVDQAIIDPPTGLVIGPNNYGRWVGTHGNKNTSTTIPRNIAISDTKRDQAITAYTGQDNFIGQREIQTFRPGYRQCTNIVNEQKMNWSNWKLRDGNKTPFRDYSDRTTNFEKGVFGNIQKNYVDIVPDVDTNPPTLDKSPDYSPLKTWKEIGSYCDTNDNKGNIVTGEVSDNNSYANTINNCKTIRIDQPGLPYIPKPNVHMSWTNNIEQYPGTTNNSNASKSPSHNIWTDRTDTEHPNNKFTYRYKNIINVPSKYGPVSNPFNGSSIVSSPNITRTLTKINNTCHGAKNIEISGDFGDDTCRKKISRTAKSTTTNCLCDSSPKRSIYAARFLSIYFLGEILQ